MILTISIIVSFIIGYGISYIISLHKINDLKLINSKLEQYKDVTTTLGEKFKNIAMEAIINEQADLRKQNQENLDAKLKPLADNLGKFMEQVNNFDKNENANFEVFKENIKKLEEKHKEITEETSKLTQALTSNQNVKGKYGEDLLSCVLEKAGLQEHINYTKQLQTSSENNKTEEIKNIIPDFVINLPNNNSLIIDSKVTLDSFIEFQNKQNSNAKKAFISALNKRINDLSDKNYQKAAGLNQPEFVLMYIPIEPAINLIYTDNDFEKLVRDAYTKNVLIIGTSSVLTTINLVKELWAMQVRSEHNKEIAAAGKALYENFATHFEALESIEESLEDVKKEFSKTINRYRTRNAGDKSILKQVERLKELGISTTKELPQSFRQTLETEEVAPEEITGETENE